MTKTKGTYIHYIYFLNIPLKKTKKKIANIARHSPCKKIERYVLPGFSANFLSNMFAPPMIFQNIVTAFNCTAKRNVNMYVKIMVRLVSEPHIKSIF